MPTVTPCLLKSDQIGSLFNIFVLAVSPSTTKPVMPCCSGGTLVKKVLNTFGQFGAETVRSLPQLPFSITFFKFGNSPRMSTSSVSTRSFQLR